MDADLFEKMWVTDLQTQEKRRADKNAQRIRCCLFVFRFRWTLLSSVPHKLCSFVGQRGESDFDPVLPSDPTVILTGERRASLYNPHTDKAEELRSLLEETADRSAVVFM